MLRKSLFAVLLAIMMASPTFADEVRSLTPGCLLPIQQDSHGHRVCATENGIRRIGLYGTILRGDRRFKFTFSFSTDRLSVQSPGASINEQSDGGPFASALSAGLNAWLGSKSGMHTGRIDTYPALSDATLYVLTNTPSQFSNGEYFWLPGGTRSGKDAGRVHPNWSIEFRPRLGDEQSRWRLGSQLAYSVAAQHVATSWREYIEIVNMAVFPYSRESVAVTGQLQHRRDTVTFTSQVSAWQFTIGPEYELFREGPVDLSVEGGLALFVYTTKDKDETAQTTYSIFAPEILQPEADPSDFLQDSAAVSNGWSDWSARQQLYLGIRGEVYPFQKHLGIGAGVRWYARGLPFTHTSTPSQYDPFSTSARAKHWVFSLSMTVAWPHFPESQ